LIDDLHSSNDQLAQEEIALVGEREMLKSGSGGAADAELSAELQRLRIVDGLDPVAGPGVTITIDAPLTEVDLQDAVNNLRIGGAEAISVAGQRVVTGSVIRRLGGTIEVDGVAVQGPWVLQAIGDPGRLPAATDQMTRSLRSDPRVRSAAYSPSSLLEIAAVVRPRPFVYALSP
jgi:uncharacterized protein YlxW (UPF0749 family)